jgi:uncharacterized membrane protein
MSSAPSIACKPPDMPAASGWRRAAAVLAAGATLAFPFAVYFGLQAWQPRWLGLALLVLLLLRNLSRTRAFAAGVAPVEWALSGVFLLFAAGIVGFNSATLLLLYPFMANLFVLILFGRTLRTPPSMIERLARLSEPDLPPEAIAYTRRVTQAWCALFAFNCAMSLLTLFASREIWLLYNGLIAYLLIGLLFAGERLLRGRLRAAAS